MSDDPVPPDYRDLLERPLFGHLATLRPDGSPQVNPMWFVWDGTHLRFTTTSTRQKHRNVTADPRVSVSVNDPDQPYRYLELRGKVVAIEPDPTAALFTELASRYGADFDGPPADAADRIVLVVRPEASSKQ
jgi:PPOX class probable F420-dependent enzyme